MDMSNIFGANANRPDHADFWKLSSVLLRLDSGLDPSNPDEAAKEAQYKARLDELGIDSSSLAYAATQRAMRALGIETQMELAMKADVVMMLTSVWIDAFAAGAFYERES